MPVLREFIHHSFPEIDRLDAELLIAHVLKQSREWVLTHPEYLTTPLQQQKIASLVKRRASGEPFAYIVEQKEFYGLDFAVNKHALIPRPETELLVEKTLEHIQKTANKTQRIKMRNVIIDVGTGSGNIIIAFAKHLVHYPLATTHYSLHGVDIFREALQMAKRNAKRHGVEKKIKFFRSDLLEKFLSHRIIQSFSHVTLLANLPYLSRAIYQSASKEVKNFEPQSALVSSQAGLGHYHKLFRQIQKLRVAYPLLPVTCFLEFSPEQKPALAQMIKKSFPRAEILFFRDVSHRWRAVEIRA